MKKKTSTHHIIPKSKGGDKIPDNTVEIVPVRHEAYHQLFGNHMPDDIIKLFHILFGREISRDVLIYLNIEFWDNKYRP